MSELSKCVAQLERRVADLDHLAGQMLVTLALNFGKGHSLDELRPMADGWRKMYEEAKQSEGPGGGA